MLHGRTCVEKLQHARPNTTRQNLANNRRVVLVHVHEKVVLELQFVVVAVELHVTPSSNLAVLEELVHAGDVVLGRLQQLELDVVRRRD